MRMTFLGARLAVAGLLAASPVSAELVMTAPAPVLAGHGATLAFTFNTAQYDRDPSTVPVASVDGTVIRVDVNAECAHVSCDVFGDALFRVELPPLAAGEYTVELYPAPGATEAGGTFALQVVEGEPARVLPAEGFWTRLSQPGTGLHIQHRGELLAVSQFDFRDQQPRWRLDAAPLHGDTALVQLRDFVGGSCFACVPHEAPTADLLGGEFLRLRFDSARQLRVERADGTTLPLVSMPFGADYVEATFQTPEQTAFDPLPLPDLSGRWAIPSLRTVDSIRFGPAEHTGTGSVVFTEVDPAFGGPVVIECMAQAEGQPAGCRLDDTAPSPPRLDIAFAALGDVEEQRVRFRDANGETAWAVRVPPGGVDGTLPTLPSEGFWMIPGQPGTGLHLQHRGGLLAAYQFDFADNGSAHWRLGVAPLPGTTAELPLASYVGGSCFGCTPHVAPQVEGDPLLAGISFDSARRAQVALPGGPSVPLVNLAFGADYVEASLAGAGDAEFGPLALPDLSGTWALGSGWDDVVPDVVIIAPRLTFVELHGPVIDGDSVVFDNQASGDSRVRVLCRAGTDTAAAGCEVRTGELAIGTPPPGWYPFARLGDVEENRIRFVFREQTADGQWRAVYWVRVPAPS